MWGETMFGIEEDHYEVPDMGGLDPSLAPELPKEDKLHRFKKLFENWLDKIEDAKKNIPQFRDSVARRVINMEMAQIEKEIGLYDVMGECKIQSEEFFKMANIFTNLWQKLDIAETKVSSH